MSKRFENIFKSKNPKTKLVSYFVGCYPDPDTCYELIKKAIDNGVSIIEIGYCTSEASAEGPVIKLAHDYVLKNGFTLKNTIQLVKKIRDYNDNVGIVLMGYIANLYKYPIKDFVQDIKKSGADAVLVVDAPHELKEENELRDALNKNGLSLIKLAAPTTDTGAFRGDGPTATNGGQYLPNSGGIESDSAVGQPLNLMNPHLIINYIIYTGRST